MAEITAAMVKALREATGLGMMDCKNSLVEAAGDVEAAKDLLRKKGLTTAEKKSGRSTSEGLGAIRKSDDGASVVMIEIRCETDFCARNSEFKSMVNTLATLAAESGDGPVEATDAMNSRLQETLAKVGENMSYARGIRISAPCIGTYVHHNGKVGVVVGVDGELADETLADLCMHIAFADPMGITADDVPADIVEKETEIAKQQAIESGKPEHIAEKMVAGKVNKFLSANALLEQSFVRDDKKKVKDILGGATVTVFARYAVGVASE